MKEKNCFLLFVFLFGRGIIAHDFTLPTLANKNKTKNTCAYSYKICKQYNDMCAKEIHTRKLNPQKAKEKIFKFLLSSCFGRSFLTLSFSFAYPKAYNFIPRLTNNRFSWFGFLLPNSLTLKHTHAFIIHLQKSYSLTVLMPACWHSYLRLYRRSRVFVMCVFKSVCMCMGNIF